MSNKRCNRCGVEVVQIGDQEWPPFQTLRGWMCPLCAAREAYWQAIKSQRKARKTWREPLFPRWLRDRATGLLVLGCVGSVTYAVARIWF